MKNAEDRTRKGTANGATSALKKMMASLEVEGGGRGFMRRAPKVEGGWCFARH